MRPAAGSKAWAALSAYESTELVKRFAKEKVGRVPNATKAREIAAHFAQGREYFRNATGASELVRPLILYYGAMALARGASLFLKTSKSKISGGHGLNASGWQDLNAKPEMVSGLPVEVKREGTFPELARVSGNTERCMVRSNGMPSEVSVRSRGPELTPGTRATIREALGQIPDVAELYERTGITSVSWTDSIYATALPSIVAHRFQG